MDIHLGFEELFFFLSMMFIAVVFNENPRYYTAFTLLIVIAYLVA